MDKIWLKNYQPGIPTTIEDQMEKYRSIGDLIEESFTKYSQTEAFNCMGKGLTYAEIDTLSRQFASYLQNDLKLAKGDRVAIMLPNILQFPGKHMALQLAIMQKDIFV